MERPNKKLKTKTVSIKPPTQQKSSNPTSKPTKKKADAKTQAKSVSISNPEDAIKTIPSKKEKAKAPSTRRLVVVSGSYDKILYGLQIEPTGRETGQTSEFKPIFVFPAHISCVKAVAASPQGGKWLASGGTDEIIKVWDLRRKKELGSLQQHQGSVTHLSFPTRTHLLSASEDGTMVIYHTRDWSVMATLKGHRDRVNDVAVHPSAKVCLSVGKDRTLRMWDLMRGKGSASMKLGKEGECVRWTPSGTRFAISSGLGIEVYSTKMALLQSITHSARIHNIGFCKGPNGQDLLLVAAEDKRVTLYLLPNLDSEHESSDEDDIAIPRENPPVFAYLSGHTNRVKALDILVSQGSTFVATVSSDGRIHLYDLDGLQQLPTSNEPQVTLPMAVYDTNESRLTCVTITEGGEDYYVESVLKRKRKHDEGDGDGDEDDDGD
ncbi:hypothetical protein M408DRAFT_326639 [Serendipita vermifera MAFF 305830]|uniref:Uncharacterized protein n=1 Tax=Serendipita vermifera MAFF 305830 TaxID=933852 RepID=A0A0C2X428_SERVB|nr:hypothetical protein M408DRAFT_326639 [Serendipita vermifera MAFF 305830]